MSVTTRLFADLPGDRVLTDPDVMASYLHDDAAWAEHGAPVAVVRPESTAEVAAVVRECAERRIPVVPRGAGTGLSGGANAVEGGIVLTLERMAAILEINPAERLAVVQPGVVNDTLRAAAKEQGLWYPPDPASAPWSTIGGNVATNAGGLCCVKYGVTRDYVLALELVTASGEITRVGRRTAKGVAGYDLAGLMVGSEGTLGVITEVTVRLRPLRTVSPRTVVGFFGSLAEAGDAVARVTAQGLQPAAFELIDRYCLQAVNAWKGMGLREDAAALLLAQTDLPEPAADQEAAAIHDAFLAAGATEAMASTDPVEAEALFDARRLAGPALLWQHEDAALTEDVCLPRGQLATMLARIEEISERHATPIATIAHAGDGNLHPTLIAPHGDEAAKANALAAFDAIIDAALELGGTVTGEHGVGLLKRDGMHREVGPVALAMQRSVKAALDPHGILNPGKVMRVILFPALADPSDRVALRFGPHELTYTELAAAAAALGPALAGRSRVAVHATPTIETAVGIVAALQAGVPVVPLNPKLGELERGHVLTDSAPELVLAAPGTELPYALPRVDVDVTARTSGPAAGAELDPAAPALVIYTSGTTGPPKGAVLSRRAVAANLDALAAAWAWTGDDVLAHALPLFHVHGLVLGVLGPLRRGGTLHHLGALDAETLAASGASMAFGVPTQYHRLAGQLEADPEAAATIGRFRLLVSGSAALTAVDHGRLKAATGLAVRERYGMTETLILTAVRADSEPEPGTVGPPLDGVDVRVVGDDEMGAVEVRGPSLFEGYLNRPGPVVDADGWFATGDIGRWTPSGALALVGRSGTDLIKSGGYKIGAGEIENALLEHPGVAEAAVIGLPDDDLGERIVAHVVPAGEPPAERELIDHVATLLSPHKRPRSVVFTDALPRNDMGKVVKARLKS